jgi:hypothetical protein
MGSFRLSACGKTHASGPWCFSDPDFVPRTQIAHRQDALALGGLRFVDIAAPVPLIDSDAALSEVDVLLLQAGHFGNARPGVEARLADQEVRIGERG